MTKIIQEYISVLKHKVTQISVMEGEYLIIYTPKGCIDIDISSNKDKEGIIYFGTNTEKYKWRITGDKRQNNLISIPIKWLKDLIRKITIDEL